MARRILRRALLVQAVVLGLLVTVGPGVLSASQETGRYFQKTGKHFEQVIGPDGGVVRFAGATLTIPAGALDGPQTITVDVVKPKARHRGGRILGTIYDFGPDGLQFQEPVSLRIPAIVNSSQPGLGIYWFNPSKATWELLVNSSYDPKARTVTASLKHFSTYAAGSSEEDLFTDGFSPYRHYFVNNNEIVSPQSGTLRIVRDLFDVPGRSGLDLAYSDIWNSESGAGSNIPVLSYSVKYTWDGQYIGETTDSARLTWNGAQYDVIWDSFPDFGKVRVGGSTLSVEIANDYRQVGWDLDGDGFPDHFETFALPVSAAVYDPQGNRYFFAEARQLSEVRDRTGSTTLTYSGYDSENDVSTTISDHLGRRISVGRPIDPEGVRKVILSDTGNIRAYTYTQVTAGPEGEDFYIEQNLTDPDNRTTRLIGRYKYDSTTSQLGPVKSLTIEYPSGGKSEYVFGTMIAGWYPDPYDEWIERPILCEHRRFADKTDTTPVSVTTYQYETNTMWPVLCDHDGQMLFTLFDISRTEVTDEFTRTVFEYDAPIRYQEDIHYAATPQMPSYNVPGPHFVTTWDKNVATLDLTNFLERVENVYDSSGNLTKKTVYKNGSSTPSYSIEWQYDDWGNVIYVKDANGHEKYFSYLNTNSSGTFPANTHGFSNSFYANSVPANMHSLLAGSAEIQTTGDRKLETYYKYKADGSLEQVKQLHKGAWVYTNYTTDAYGNVTSVTDADNKTVNYVYGTEYGYAYPTEEWRTVNKVMVGGVEMDGVRVSRFYGYDPLTGELTSVQDPNGNVTGYQYDVLGRLTRVTYPKLSTEPAPAFKEADYNDEANTKTAYNELGVPTKFYYDGLGRLWKAETYAKDGSGNFTVVKSTKTLTYDSADRVKTETLSADGKTYVTSYDYDALGRLTKTTFPDGTFQRIEYVDKYTDPDGVAKQLKIVWDENNQKKEFGYDWLGRLMWVKEYPVKGNTTTFIKTSYEYDQVGNLIKVTDANSHVTRYDYDELGHLLTTTYPDGTIQANVCTATGDVTSRTDRKGVTVYQDFDEAHRLLAKRYPDGSSANYRYDKAGAAAKAWNATATVTYQYDERGRLANLTRLIDGVSYPITYVYDAASNLTQLTGPDGIPVAYAYTEQNQPQTVTGFVNEPIEYYDVGPVKRITYANGVVADYSDYDLRLRPETVVVNKDLTNVLSLTYTYDNVGNVTSYAGQTFDYDGLDRLTSVTGAFTATYTYDNVGNRKTSLENGVSRAYDYGLDDRILYAGPVSFTHDPNGNMTGRSGGGAPTYGYTYDYENRLTDVAENGTAKATYAYDPDGMRVKAVEGGQTTIYIYNGNDIIYEKTGASATKYVYLLGKTLAKVKDGVVTYYHNDHLGSTRAMTDSTGAVVANFTYEPFGNTATQTGTGAAGESHKFTGKAEDSGTGLYYYGARFYDPTIGRFITEDPAKDGPNWYVYCENNPLRYTDPTGMLHIIDGNPGEDDFFTVTGDLNPEEPGWQGHIVEGGREFPNPVSQDVADTMLTGDTRWMDSSVARLSRRGDSFWIHFIGLEIRRFSDPVYARNSDLVWASIGMTAAIVSRGERGGAGRIRMTAKQAEAAAAKLGFRKTSFRSKGEPVFTNGRYYITPDRSGHNGGVWKMATSVEGLWRKETRLGTYDASLRRIGD